MGGCKSVPDRLLRITQKSTMSDNDIIENEIMQFLIILNEDDFISKCVCSNKYSTRVKSSGNYLSGILDVENVTNLMKRNKYRINDVVNLKTLYVKLPKENLFIKSDRWQFEYMKSQIREILYIFGLLGAKTVIYSVLSSNSASLNIMSEVTAGNLPLESSANFTNKSNLSTEISGNLEYDVPKYFPSDDIFDMKDVYYLKRKYEWIDVCTRRIVNSVKIDNFTYKFNNDLIFSIKVTEKLKNLGISFNVDSEETKNFSMNFKVTYYTKEEIIILNTRTENLFIKLSQKDSESDNEDNINNLTEYHSEDDTFYTNKDFQKSKLNYYSDNETKKSKDIRTTNKLRRLSSSSKYAIKSSNLKIINPSDIGILSDCTYSYNSSPENTENTEKSEKSGKSGKSEKSEKSENIKKKNDF